LRRVKAIKEHYIAREQTIITESIRVDLAELDKIEYTVEAQEVEVRNPTNAPFVIENELLFESGKYDVLTSVAKLDAIIADIQEKIANCRLNYPSMAVKVALAVTGYADEQDVKNDLKYKLYIKYPLEKPTAITEETQESLNKLLSQARADNVFNYIKEKVVPSSQFTSTTFLQTGAVGKGWQYPVKLNPPCQDDCQQRRVVYISHIVFPE
jgi:outer membrane protein OmpA-like peptidoglycan-associated protein